MVRGLVRSNAVLAQARSIGAARLLAIDMPHRLRLGVAACSWFVLVVDAKIRWRYYSIVPSVPCLLFVSWSGL